MVGMADEESQRKLFTKPDITLAQAEKLVVAEEIGKLSQADSRSVNGLSLYKQQQKQNNAVSGKKCRFCGGAWHEADPGVEPRDVRRLKCPAFGEQCRECNGWCHFAKQCHLFANKSDKKGKDTKDKTETAEALYTENSDEEECLLGIEVSAGDNIANTNTVRWNLAASTDLAVGMESSMAICYENSARGRSLTNTNSTVGRCDMD